ncbi:hypothetical protein PPYR_04025 [Photinus pyralis]|uniref:Uncharacterized protein n=1 Tax=Photinus pyralis TaxID=7054 RepID=A0A1Y1NCX1_PHOPY|nr:uncharacterized protein LOC116163809 [Photinus pyralis]KAB0801839.1 hypothetical protein PPYR_04025 [Photinus pyralis]
MKKNLLCFVFFCCAVQVFSKELPDELIDEKIHECLKELNLDKKILSTVFDDKFQIKNLSEDGVKLTKCGIKKGNYYTPDGEFNREVMVEATVKTIKSLVKHEVHDVETVADSVFEKCKTRKGEDAVAETTNLNNCVMNEIFKL